MKSISRITAISFLLTAVLLGGCDTDTVVSPPKSSSQATSVSSTEPTAQTTSVSSAELTTAQTTAPEQQPIELQIVYHPEALWTPSSVKVDSDYNTIETANGCFRIGKYGYYDEKGNQIEIDPDQKIAIGFDTNIGVEHEYSDLPDEIKAVIPEKKYQIYSWSGYKSGMIFIEDWLESQGFEVLKDHACHHSWDYAVPIPDYHTFRYGVLIITTPRQLAEFKMPYPQALITFWGAYYEDFAPEFMKFSK